MVGTIQFWLNADLVAVATQYRIKVAVEGVRIGTDQDHARKVNLYAITKPCGVSGPGPTSVLIHS
jgi:hypothetical protein